MESPSDQPMKQTRPLSILFLICLLWTQTLSAREVPSGGEMLIDLIVARPMGLAGTVLGTAAFIVASPFTLLSGTFLQSGRRLVVYPAKFTFTRGLGDFPGYMEDYQIVEE
ncbi:hypothetical protein LPTSP2_34710 [Leptospira ellinghausenii]|uniref:Uncharacterized protein n=5 Tax=Leptospira TaxID=171 RepID=A0A2P2DHT2_9LEPT|nr:hypothetical protein LPTSP2_34710 [Leptospira ellinghausenii]